MKKRKMRAQEVEWRCQTTFTKRKFLIFHDQYNTKYEVETIPNEIYREIRCKPD